MDTTALFRIGYGLYVLTTHDGERDNGMIVNTVMQVTGNPNRVAVTVNKQAYSHDVIRRTGKMTVNCLAEDTPFAVFERFGYQSGRDVDKFAQGVAARDENGLALLPEYANAYLSLSLESYVDLDTHGMFICTLTGAEVLSQKPSMTYAYYQENVKPKRAPEKKKGYVCRICGWVYEGDELPSDIVCPICRHGAADFEPIT